MFNTINLVFFLIYITTTWFEKLYMINLYFSFVYTSNLYFNDTIISLFYSSFFFILSCVLGTLVLENYTERTDLKNSMYMGIILLLNKIVFVVPLVLSTLTKDTGSLLLFIGFLNWCLCLITFKKVFIIGVNLSLILHYIMIEFY
jgi:hypothetical protein